MAMPLPAGARGLRQAPTDTPPPLRLLQRWQPPALPAAGATPGPTGPTGPWARWRLRLRALLLG
ncbi:MAG: hypothetical protein HY855_22915 [Burkholderiales bacterium]|nr:hypothetical protein [Burkholderiales bacterium]